MDARARFQALQAHLTSARAAIEAGDRAAAMAEANAAIAIDPAFLAAQALRERLLAAPPAAPLPTSGAVRPVASGPAVVPSPRLAPAPDAYAKFEERARRRRVDRRLDAARAALAQQHLKAAAAALDEVIDLDPGLPELGELTAQFDDLRRSIATPHRGPWVVAASVFAAALLGAATWPHDSSSIASRSMVAAAMLPAPPLPGLTLSRAEPIGTAGEGEQNPVESPSPMLGVRSGPALEPAPPVRPAPPESRPTPRYALAAPIDSPPPAVAEMPRTVSETAPIAPPVPPAPPARETVDDTSLVNAALKRYRVAYDGLDAQSARAIWPAVNQAALARAFNGLQSQTLTFDSCDLRLYSETASATCRGTARYVPKVGSRETRVESRVWTFTLRKTGSEWTIDSARVER